MGPIAVRALLRRCRGRATAVGVLVAIVVAVAMHHAAPLATDGHHAPDTAAVAQMCLAAFTAVGAAAIAVALSFVLLRRRRRPAITILPSGAIQAGAPPEPRARAGPPLFARLCVSRR